jgi:hypothetical protein
MTTAGKVASARRVVAVAGGVLVIVRNTPPQPRNVPPQLRNNKLSARAQTTRGLRPNRVAG